MLTSEDIDRLFAKINDGLSQQNLKGIIILAGGAVMTFVVHARDMTYDIDALFEPADKIRDIAKQIAFDEDLEEDWINDGVKGFVDI